MWVCKKCGSNNSDNYEKCHKCGQDKEAQTKGNGRIITKQSAALLSFVLVVAVAIIWFFQRGGKEPQNTVPAQDTNRVAEVTTSVPSDADVYVPVSTPTVGNPIISSWTDVVSIDSGSDFIAGLRADGTVVVEIADDSYYQLDIDVSAWRDITKISAAGATLIGLKADGTVVAAGEDYEGQADISSWKDIVDISTSGAHTVGARSDGQIEYAGFYN